MDKCIIIPHSQRFAELMMFGLPPAIADFYENKASFKFINTNQHFALFSKLTLLSLKKVNIELGQVPMTEYIKGLNEGYTQNFIPFIDTPEARKEIVLRAVIKSNSSIRMTRDQNKTYFITNNDSYRHGFELGKVYRAWDYIFETPFLYTDNFRQLTAEPKNEPVSLETIFSDSKDLHKLVELLIEKKFVSEEAGRLIWTGIEHERASGRGYQLVTLSEVCKPYYDRNYTQKVLYNAWTKHFNSDIEYNNFKRSVIKDFMTDSYKRLFNFVLHTI